jgi:hypothetical protein
MATREPKLIEPNAYEIGSIALDCFVRARTMEAVAHKAFDEFVDKAFAEFTEKEWRSFYALNDRLFERSKTKPLKRNEYQTKLLTHAIKTIEKRTRKGNSK